MCLIGPVAMLQLSPSASSQTQPDGRSVYSVFSRLGQWGIAPLCACPSMSPGVRSRSLSGTFLHAIGVQQRRRILPEHRPEGARGRREAERAAGSGFTCDMASARSAVTRQKAAARMLKAIHARESREACGRKAKKVADELESVRLGADARTVRDGFAETLAYTEFPPEH